MSSVITVASDNENNGDGDGDGDDDDDGDDHSTLISKLFFLAVQGSGALLSSNLEGALYKSP